MPTRAVCVLAGPYGVQGTITFSEDAQGTMVGGRVQGLTSREVGMRVHQLGDVTSGATSCGQTYNPGGVSSMSSREGERVPGDLGVYPVAADGTVELSYRDRSIPLSGQFNILGRAVVVHSLAANVSAMDSRVAWGSYSDVLKCKEMQEVVQSPDKPE